jgi:hypothetical protein
MGLGDKFKNLTKQAQDAVADHRGDIHGAVQRVGAAADQRTKGKYSDKIAKFGQKADDAIDKVAPEDPEDTPAAEGASAPHQPSTAPDPPSH